MPARQILDALAFAVLTEAPGSTIGLINVASAAIRLSLRELNPRSLQDVYYQQIAFLLRPRRPSLGTARSAGSCQ